MRLSQCVVPNFVRLMTPLFSCCCPAYITSLIGNCNQRMESSPSQTACHWLPCSIDYDGQAPVSQYFRPEPIDPNNNSDAATQGATFRGRGLLAKKVQRLPDGIEGNVLVACTRHSGQVKVCESFKSVYEWEHEWNPQRLVNHTQSTTSVGDIQSKSSVQKSIALMDLMRAVHDPIPSDA